jgi:tetratricopeptide (TPR) repeat protein
LFLEIITKTPAGISLEPSDLYNQMMRAPITPIKKRSTAAQLLLATALLAMSGAPIVFAPPAESAETAASNLKNGIALYQKKDYQGAIRLLHAANSEQQTATASYYSALCYEQLRYHDQAVTMFKRVSTFWPASDEAGLATAYLKKLAEQTASTTPPVSSTADATAAKDKDTFAADVKKSEHITRAEWAALPNKTRVLIAREHGHLMVTAKVNGQWGKFAFDTGATCCGVGILDYPNMFTPAQLASAKRVNVSRPHGVVTGWEMTADITLQDITRKVKFLVLPEKNVCVIGQNFFKEYSYQIDDFYVRLTKAPYQGDDVAGGAAVATTGSAQKPTTAVVSAGAGGGSISAALMNGPSGPAKLDRYTIPFEREYDTMLIDITVNGVPTKATFDTGCAPDGIVCHPNFAAQAHMDHPTYIGNRANRLVIGSIIRMDVPVYYANGLGYPLVGPKIFNRPYTVDPVNKLIRFDY